MSNPYKILFEAGHFGSLKVKNRLVMPPMVRDYADKDGLVTRRYVDHIERIAKGGVGTMILEASFVSPEGKGFVNELGIHTDATIPGLKKLAKAAHKYGAAIGPQLYHAGRQTVKSHSGFQPVAPSPIPDPSSNEMPRELSVPEIKNLVQAYARAAARAKAAGMDFVELHGAHGYLITQFLSPFSNQRADQYGGTPEKRMRFMIEVFEAVRKAVRPKFPITVRLSGDELVPEGLKIDDTIKIAKKLEELGAAALHISAGNYASYAQGKMIPPMAMTDAPLLPLAKKVKQAVTIPVIAVAKIRTPDLAKKILASNSADFVALGRTLLADPDWPNKVKAGKVTEINECIACNQGCISRLFAQQDVWCTINPATGRETEFKKKVYRKKKVLVIGGGAAGMMAARLAAERGHKVALWEAGKKLGGQLYAVAAAPYRGDWNYFRAKLMADLKRLKVPVKLNFKATPENILKAKPEAVILALGSSPTRPNIPGVYHANVLIARDILERRVKAKGRVVIAGGGCLGAQTAEYLAEKGHPVTIVEALAEIAADAPIDEKVLLLERLAKYKVAILKNTRLVSLEPKAVVVKDAAGTKSLPADTIVLCLGSKANDGLAETLKPKIKRVMVIGDAVKPRHVTEAVAEAALAVLSL